MLRALDFDLDQLLRARVSQHAAEVISTEAFHVTLLMILTSQRSPVVPSVKDLYWLFLLFKLNKEKEKSQKSSRLDLARKVRCKVM